MRAALAGAALALVAATPAAAIDMGATFTINEIRAQTPKCLPGAGPYVGRVSGFVGFGADGARLAGFEGCFPTAGECEFWRLRVSGYIDGRIVLNQCGPR